MNMTPPKLKPSHIYIITAVLAAVILGAIGWFWLKPDYEKIKTLTASVEALQAEGSPANLASAQNELADARKFVVDQQRIFSGMERRFFLIGDRRSPQPLDLKDRFKALQVLAIEQSQVLAPTINAWARNTPGITLLQGVSAPALSPDPNAIPTTVIRTELTGMKVTGTFEAVMRLLRSTGKLNRLVTLNSVTLTQGGAGATDTSGTTGTSLSALLASLDTVTADIGISSYLFPRNGANADKFPVPAGAEGQGGMGGMAGGLPGPSVGPRPMPGGPPTPGASIP
ncbi:MAG: hypothetical protein GYA63_04780 [Armatimonadetes bacterium]|jgi:Tfp pilus assembly protein PilO|nr:hypothetical protein [Armatimonadota bacterium]